MEDKNFLKTLYAQVVFVLLNGNRAKFAVIKKLTVVYVVKNFL